jgi:predicted metal-binding membrane protein
LNVLARADRINCVVNRAGHISYATPAVLGLVVAGAWVATVTQSSMIDPSAPAFLGLWTAMMAAMMLPSASPLLLLYRRSANGMRTAALASGYLFVWAALGVLAYAYMRSGVMVPGWAVLGAAGLYQLTPLKSACLNRCRTPADFLVVRWGRDPLRLGVEHGAWCAGCCWGLMVVLVVAGSMGLAWVAGLATVVLAEKLFPYGNLIARATGVALVTLAVTEGVVGWPGV